MRFQIQIRSGDIPNDRACVERILLTAAEKYDLIDNTITSRVPNTIVSVVERDGFGVGARIVNDLVIVDFNPKKSESGKFDDFRRLIENEIRQIFGQVSTLHENESGYIESYARKQAA